MNVFSNNLLIAIGMLYFIVSGVKCRCFPSKTTLSELFPTKKNECMINLKSKRVSDRQICPSWTKVNTDHRRSPETLIEKKCCRNECSAGEGYKCEEYKFPVDVIYDFGKNTEKSELIFISVACVCTAPRCLPEPPRK